MASTRKDVEVICPCCGVEMLVDMRTGKIIRHSKEVKTNANLDDVIQQESSRDKNPDKKFATAFGELQKRKNQLDDVFNEAKKKAEEEGPEGLKPDPFRWD